MLVIGYSRQHRVAAGAGARDRHRRRRRDRGRSRTSSGSSRRSRSCRSRTRPRRRWPRSPAPIIAITLVLLSVFVPVAFIPGISGQLFRQFAVAVSAVDADLGGQRADPEPGPVRGAAEARHGARRGPMQLRAGRHRPRAATAMPSIVRRLVRVAVVRPGGGGRRRCRGTSALFRITPQGFLPDGGPGRVLCRDAAARGRFA